MSSHVHLLGPTRRRASVCVALGVATALVAPGCAFRRSVQNTSVQSSVQIDQGGAGGVATLTREEYEVRGTSSGKDKTTRVFVLWFPVGNHKSASEVWDSAYSNAVDNAEDCDGLLLPRTRVKRVVVPLLLVNVIVKKVQVKGRCIRIKDDAALARTRHHGAHSKHHGKHHGAHGKHHGMHGKHHGAHGKPHGADGEDPGKPHGAAAPAPHGAPGDGAGSGEPAKRPHPGR